MIDNYEDIQKPFRLQLESIAGLPEKAWENTSYEPKKDTPWLRETLLHGKEIPSATDEVTQPGVMQYDLFYSSGSGTKDIKQKADTIKHAFKPGTILSNKVRCRTASVRRGDNDAPWFSMIIEIEYSIFSTNS